MAIDTTYPERQYGAQTLAGDAPEAVAPRAAGGLTWGKVLKGAAVVAAIAVVAVVGYVALSGLATWAMGSAAVSGAVGTVAPAITTAANGAAYGAGWLSSFVTVQIPAFFSGLATGLGFTAPAAVAAGTAAAPGIISTAGVVGAGGAAAIAASHHHGIANFFDSITTPDTHAATDEAANAFMATKKASFASGMSADHASHGAHASTDLAHHAGEHSQHNSSKSWRQQVSTPNRFSYNGGPEQSYAEAVRAQQSRSPVQPRDPNFAQQLDADRAKLDDALNGRA